MSPEDFIRKSSIPYSLKGREYIIRAMELIIENPEIKMQEIEMQIALERKCTVVAVDKCLSRIIKLYYEDMPSEFRESVYFGKKNKITTKEFLYAAVDYVKHN